MYTTQGLMYASDYQEYLKDTDQGSTEIDLTGGQLPDWLDLDLSQPCPVCHEMLWNHDAVRIGDASGEIYACDNGDGWELLVTAAMEPSWPA